MSTITAKQMISGMVAMRVNNPKTRNSVQKNSAKMVSESEAVWPMCSGSENFPDMSLKFESFFQPCVSMIADARRNSREEMLMAVSGLKESFMGEFEV